MDKLIKVILVLLVLGIGGVGFLQWQSYEKKAELRSDALLYFNEEDYSKAIEYLEKGLSIKSLFGGAIDKDMNCYLAESYYRMDDFEKAESIYHKLQRMEPNQPIYYLLEGQSCASAGDYDKAMEIFNKGYQKTKDPSFMSEICEIYIEQKKYKKALDYAKKGIGDGSSASARLMFELIVIYEKSLNYKAAYKAARDYCDHYPEDEKGHRELIFLSSRV